MPKGDTEKILSIANANNGIVTASMVSEAGISRECLRLLAADGRLERSARGVYYVNGIIADEFFNAHSMFKRGIFSHETALFLHGLTETTPVALSMAFPTAYNYSGAKSFGIICHSSGEARTHFFALKETLRVLLFTVSPQYSGLFSIERTLPILQEDSVVYAGFGRPTLKFL